MVFTIALALLSAFTVHILTQDEDLTDPPQVIWKLDLETRRRIIHEKFAKELATENKTFDGPKPKGAPRNRSLREFIDKFLVEPDVQYRIPDNWTINNLIENNEHALFRPYVIEDYVKKYGLDKDDNKDMKGNNGIEKGWTFKDFVEKYEPMAVCEQIEEKINAGQNFSRAKDLLSIVDSLDSTDELLSLPVPPQSGRRWQFHYAVPNQRLNATGREPLDIKNVLKFMKQSIYEARERMSLMQTLREKYRESAVYKMGYLFAKTDYACKVFSSLAYKSFRTCSMIRQKIFGDFRLYYHYMDIAYSIERLEARWFDVDLLKDLITSNDLISRKVILKDKNLTSPEMVVKAFDAMFIN